MKVFGFRADPNSPRFAIVEKVDEQFTLLNSSSDNKLAYPVQCIEVSDRLVWLYREFERIIIAHEGISSVVIKANEYGTESSSKRFSSYQDAALVLLCGFRGIRVDVKTYNSLSTKSADVKIHAASRVGQTTKYWDVKMADAVVAAWWGINNI
ncbi:hypothetical protein GTA51_17555 [Desulfovibrio aerotolerans]|uniref:Holliday junction resolvase RuvC n=1 Tax=Solidesulfovibrio aerotolerans TaxID=295255 RepID=A0A7C9IMX6_9BACT|nr:hypothetical protein [Solidesulfovibrio aerotolerans]MYL84921.1 hypothetical protein [Solidesulfovibrio aerotolerans]